MNSKLGKISSSFDSASFCGRLIGKKRVAMTHQEDIDALESQWNGGGVITDQVPRTKRVLPRQKQMTTQEWHAPFVLVSFGDSQDGAGWSRHVSRNSHHRIGDWGLSLLASNHACGWFQYSFRPMGETIVNSHMPLPRENTCGQVSCHMPCSGTFSDCML